MDYRQTDRLRGPEVRRAEEALASDVNEYDYLKYVSTERPKSGVDDDVDASLPWNVAPRTLEQLFILPRI